MTTQLNITQYIGYHVGMTGNNILPPNINYLQICLIDPQKMFDNKAVTKSTLSNYKSQITAWKCSSKFNRKIFVHGPYCINLSNRNIVHVNSLKNQLRLANEVGADGLVIHCGKSLKDKPQVAIDRFMMNVDKAVTRATDKCPLIIETCVGAGTELFHRLEDFQDMMLTLRAKYGSKIGCCIDTAHIWGAGYSPIEFINKMSPEMRQTIKLFHWNNSLVEKGSKIDRHASLENGKIKPNELWSIAFWAAQSNIPMVIE